MAPQLGAKAPPAVSRKQNLASIRIKRYLTFSRPLTRDLQRILGMHHLSLLNDVIKGYNKKTALVGSKEKCMGLVD